ncbi:MAG TPA: hypothetical protein VD996_02505 [Chitinophagaceae bacterium]|nr:hypothetical protein [Chitinophagaceae bacterium]
MNINFKHTGNECYSRINRAFPTYRGYTRYEVDNGWSGGHSVKSEKNDKWEIKKKAEPIAIQNRFQELSNQWRKETGHYSTMIHVTRNENYLRIIALGKPVVPLLLKDLQNEPDYWFEALRLLTNENPVKREHLGDLEKMSADWIEWGKNKGYIN